MRATPLFVLVLALAAACGSEDDGGTIEAGASTTAPSAGETTLPNGTVPSTAATVPPDTAGQADAVVSLTVEVSVGPEGLRSGTLVCAADGRGTGTGFLADGDAATAACTLVTTDEQARQRLVEGPPEGLMCTMIYGGPEEARVQGTIDGAAVDATITRTDGCGIADWDLLTPLLGPPGT